MARLNLGITPAGKRVRVKATAPTRAEARRKLEQLRDKHLAGVDLTQRHQTIGELVELWLAARPADHDQPRDAGELRHRARHPRPARPR